MEAALSWAASTGAWIAGTASWLFASIQQSFAGTQAAWVVLLSTAMVSGFGAYFGAWGAQRVISREARLRRKVEMVLAANAAHSLATSVFNQAAALKKQHYLPDRDRWRDQRDALLRAVNGSKQSHEVAIHMETPPPAQFPLSALSDVIYNKLILNGRPLAALSELVLAEHALSKFVQDHEKLRTEFDGRDADYVVPRYFALDTETGRDERFKNFAEGAVNVLDDLLYFSDLLGRDILAQAQRVHAASTWRERRSLPAVNEMGKLLPGKEYLLPDPQQYADWLEGHKLIDPAPPRRWLRLW